MTASRRGLGSKRSTRDADAPTPTRPAPRVPPPPAPQVLPRVPEAPPAPLPDARPGETYHAGPARRSRALFVVGHPASR